MGTFRVYVAPILKSSVCLVPSSTTAIWLSEMPEPIGLSPTSHVTQGVCHIITCLSNHDAECLSPLGLERLTCGHLVLHQMRMAVSVPSEKLCVQIPHSNSVRQAELHDMLARHNIPLQHKLCAGRLPVSLLQAASLLGGTARQAVLGDDGQPDITCSAAMEAQRSVLCPALADSKAGLQDSIARCQELQLLKRLEPMLKSVYTFVSGQAHIVDCAVQQLAQDTHGC